MPHRIWGTMPSPLPFSSVQHTKDESHGVEVHPDNKTLIPTKARFFQWQYWTENNGSTFSLVNFFSTLEMTVNVGDNSEIKQM